jgi:hypothetical protein
VAAYRENADDSTEREDLDHSKPNPPCVAKVENENRGPPRLRAVQDEEGLGAPKSRDRSRPRIRATERSAEQTG